MNENIIKKCENSPEKYPAAAYQDVNVCMPVTVKAEGEVGRIETQCIGRPVISPCRECTGKCGQSFTFTISQKIRVKVPVVFKVKAEAGDASIDYKDADDCCVCEGYND